jgi:SpoVK/Ycf46/Vps4 family AAA+-type ATPase
MAQENMLNYKFRDLKVFGSTEWLANNEKKYRLVYDEFECSFIYAELSFYNKLFDEEDWDVRINLKCVNHVTGEDMCNLSADRTIKKDENIVFVREGWGVKSVGNYWKKGIYRWEAWIDNTFVAERVFYILDYGLVTETVNPYFYIKSVRFYEGPASNVDAIERHYLDEFNSAETRYVWVELIAHNLITASENWPCELTFNFKTHAGQLKGSITKLFFIEPTDTDFECSIGWGSDVKGTWGIDVYAVEIVFMDQIITSVSFEVGDKFIEEGKANVQKPLAKVGSKKILPKAENIEHVMHELDNLIGLESIKKKVKEYTTYLNFINLRKEKGFEDNDKINLHAVFTGNPGTGKTTVAKMLGEIYHQMGLLSKGHVMEVDRSDLVAEYIGQTAPKTKEAIKKAKGGILFIDEAYALARKNDDSKDFGKEAIEIILKEMSDGDGDIAVIAAGYPDEMKTFLESNPGMKSRFNMYYDFPDYTPQELMQIADYTLAKRHVSFSKEAREAMYKHVVEAYRNRDKTFGNARYINYLIDEAKMNMGLRIMQQANPAQLTNEQLSTIEAADIEKIFAGKIKTIADIPIDEDLLKNALDALHNLIGLKNVKNEIDELVKLVRFYKEIGKDVRQSFSLHAVFTGNPGTGKTTVARILAQIFKALGILERGNLVECDRQSLVGGYVGQTALKTTDVINRAMGGVLFVDEAYSLTEGGENDFGKEAIETILKRMEDNRGEFIVIVAGYTENMKKFIESNPGLKSRFDREFHFEDYNVSELTDIAIKMFAANSIQPTAEAIKYLNDYFGKLYESRDKFFGNARNVRKVVEQAIKNQHLRLAKLDKAERKKEMIHELVLADVEEFKFDPSVEQKRTTIGFKQNS